MKKSFLFTGCFAIAVTLLLSGCGASGVASGTPKLSESANSNDLTGSWQPVYIEETDENGDTQTITLADLVAQYAANAANTNTAAPKDTSSAPQGTAAPATSGGTSRRVQTLLDATYTFNDDGTFDVVFTGDTEKALKQLESNDPNSFQSLIDSTNGTWIKKDVLPTGGMQYSVTAKVGDMILGTSSDETPVTAVFTVEDGELHCAFGTDTELYFSRR